MKKNKVFYSLLVSFFLAFFMTPVFSSWFLYPDEISNDFRLNRNYKNDGNTVAYFGTGNSRRNFTTIEGALRAAENDTSSNVVYVVPGTNPTIYSNCKIADGDTLCIPYEGETYNGRQRNAETGGTSNNSWKTAATFTGGKPADGDYIPSSGHEYQPFADSNEDFVNYFRKNNITLNPGVTLTVLAGANLQIGGILGWDGQRVTGQTSGKYCQLTRKKGSSIVNNGTIDCRGYIKEENSETNSKIVNEANSIRKIPFVFYDYKGGSYTASVYGGDTKIFPRSQYDFPNVQSEREFKHTSKLIGYVDLFTDEVKKTVSGIEATLKARHNTDDLEAIGPRGEKSGNNTISHLFETSQSSDSIIIKRTPNNYKYTLFSNKGADAITDFVIDGSCFFNRTSISVNAAADASLAKGFLDWLLKAVADNLNQTITTDSVDFPIPWNFNIEVKKGGHFHIDKPMKRRPGSRLTVDKGGTLTLDNKLVVYDSSLESSQFVYPQNKTIAPYPNKGAARLINNGTRFITSSASFGGLVTTEDKDSVLVVDEKANLTDISCHEGDGSWEISGTSIRFTFNDYSNSPVTKSGAAITFERYYKTSRSGSSPNFETSSNERKLEPGTTYSSYQYNSGFGWWSGSHDRYGIQFVYQDDEGNEVQIRDNPNSGVEYLTNNGSDIALQAVTPVDTAAWTFGGFFYDKNCSVLVTDNIIKVSEGRSHLINGLLTIYTKWIPKGNFATIRWMAYAGTDKLFDQDKTIKIEEADCGTAYDLSAITSTKDSKKKAEVSQVRKIEYDLDYWKVYDSADEDHANLISDHSFIPEKGHAYIAEPVRVEEKFLWRRAKNASWSNNRYYVINDFSISNNSIRFTDGLFDAGSVLKNTNEQNGWIKLGATIVVSIEDRTGWTDVNTVSISDGVETTTYKGKNWSGGTAKVSIDTNNWVSNFNAFGPIVITCWTKG